MSIVIPHAAEERMLDLLLAANLTMRLYQNDATAGLTEAQQEALTESSFTEATFTGYTSKSLTGGSWVTTQADPSTGVYAQQTWTRTSTGATQTIYGYTIHRASDNALMWFERFTGPVATTTNGDTIRVTPTITLDDDREATVAARGIVAYQYLTTNSPAYTSDTPTDMSLVAVPADATRLYRVHFTGGTAILGIGRWFLELRQDAVTIARLCDVNDQTATMSPGPSVLWFPSTGNFTLDVYANEISGSASIQIYGDGPGRALWVEDIGPRP